MFNRVLVTYATKYGATAEIAVKIGRVLSEMGLSVDVMSADCITDLSPYRAVILGSAVYMGQWRKEATQFLKDYQSELRERLVWLFSSGPTDEGDPIDLLDGWRIPEGLEALVTTIQPRDIKVFHGVLNINKLNWFERWVVQNIKVPAGDFREWDMITSWASNIACELKQGISVPD